ncbi:hypothetical protein I9086_00115 [Campylobacter jejuni]|nr:hypothetical protein [Campylobacter jejuni]
MSNLIFKNENFGAVRVAYENNEPLFCLSDVCKILELTNPSRVKECLITEFGEDDLTNSYPIKDSLGRMQNATFITEPQLYYVLNNSRSQNKTLVNFI